MKRIINVAPNCVNFVTCNSLFACVCVDVLGIRVFSDCSSVKRDFLKNKVNGDNLQKLSHTDARRK